MAKQHRNANQHFSNLYSFRMKMTTLSKKEPILTHKITKLQKKLKLIKAKNLMTKPHKVKIRMKYFKNDFI